MHVPLGSVLMGFHCNKKKGRVLLHSSLKVLLMCYVLTVRQVYLRCFSFVFILLLNIHVFHACLLCLAYSKAEKLGRFKSLGLGNENDALVQKP